jgi:hypothetical protein
LGEIDGIFSETVPIGVRTVIRVQNIVVRVMFVSSAPAERKVRKFLIVALPKSVVAVHLAVVISVDIAGVPGVSFAVAAFGDVAALLVWSLSSFRFSLALIVAVFVLMVHPAALMGRSIVILQLA